LLKDPDRQTKEAMTNTQSTLRTAAIGLVVGALTAGIVVAATRRGAPSTRTAAASANPAEWTVADVVAWARSGPAAVPEDVAKALQREDIDGAALLQLDDAMLQSIGITKMGARLRLVQSIAALRTAAVTGSAATAPAIAAAAATSRAAVTPTRASAAASSGAPVAAVATEEEEVGRVARDAIAEMVAQFRFISSPDFLALPQAQQLQILNTAEAAFRSSAAAMARTPPAQRAELEPLVGRFGQLLTVLRARLMQQQQGQDGVAAATTQTVVSAPPSAATTETGPTPREAVLAQKLEALIDVVQSPELQNASGEALLSVLQRLAGHLSTLREEISQLPAGRQAPYSKVLDQVESLLVRMVREGTAAARAANAIGPAGAAAPAATAASASTAGQASKQAVKGASAGSVAKDVAARVQQVLATLQSRDLLSMASAQRRQMLEAAARELRDIVNEADLESLPAEAQEVVGSMISQVASYVTKLREVSEAIDASSSNGSATAPAAGSSKATRAASTPSSSSANNGAANGASVLSRLRSQLDVMRNVVGSDSFASAPETEKVAVARKIMEQLSELRELASGVLSPTEAEQFTVEIGQFLRVLREAVAGASASAQSPKSSPKKAAAAAEAHTAAARKSVSVLQRTQRLFDIIKSPQFEQAPDDRRATACSAIVAECDDLLSEAATLPAREQTEVRGVVVALRRMVASMLPGADGAAEADEEAEEAAEEVEEIEEVEEGSDVDAEVDGGAHRFTGRDSDEESEEGDEEEPLPPLAPPTPPGSDLEQELHRAARTLQSDEALSPDALAAVASGMDRAIRANRTEWQDDARLGQFVRQVMALLQRRAQELQRPGGALASAFMGAEGDDAEGDEDDEESIAAQLNEAAATLEALPALESPADLAPYMSMLEHCRAAQAGFTVAEARAYNRMQRAVLAAAQKLRGFAAADGDAAEGDEEEDAPGVRQDDSAELIDEE
jgi:hypothetical protein